jgi:hypothetical protein
VSRPRWEDGTTGGPLGDDEDLDQPPYTGEPAPFVSVLGNEPDWDDLRGGAR